MKPQGDIRLSDVRTVLRASGIPVNARDRLIVDRIGTRFRFTYEACGSEAESPDGTLLRVVCHLQAREMWIRDLRVATACRGRGWGRRLVCAAEALAAIWEVRFIMVLPLVSAMRFWRHMGFIPSLRRSRVLYKVPGCAGAPRRAALVGMPSEHPGRPPAGPRVNFRSSAPASLVVT
jgi:GNAT superfamily N-acetyltransferase